MKLGQIAMSVTDVRRTHDWYREVLDMTPAGGTSTFFGPLPERIQGLPKAASTCFWMVDGQDDFQLELFQFRRPTVRPMPPDWRPCDIGYTMVSVHVADLDATIERARAAGSPPLTEPLGEPGSRRVCVRDPEGVLIELMEDDPRSGDPRNRPADRTRTVVRSVTLSVPDLDRSCHTFSDALGLTPADSIRLHGPAHEALWGLEGAQRRSRLYWAGDILIELVQYTDPIGEPWPRGYRISDQGLLNIAFLLDDKASLKRAFDRAVAGGLRPNHKPIGLPLVGAVTYLNDPDGFSIELWTFGKAASGYFGMKPRRPPRFTPFLEGSRV